MASNLGPVLLPSLLIVVFLTFRVSSAVVTNNYDPAIRNQLNSIMSDPPSKAEADALLSQSFAEGKTNLSEVHFYLHTNENPDVADELFVGDSAALQNSHFHRDGELWILVHGFGADIGGTFPYLTGLDLLSLAPQGNVILVDWSTLAQSPNYVGAVRDAYAVSNFTAEFIQFLVEENVASPEKVHLIGFSLGGQVVGITGKRFQWLTGQTVARVTGLDPAWPLFALAEDDDRISADDAHFVDIIHTAAGTLGIVEPEGHLDFYPNGGWRQPGCGLDPVGSCAHGRAVHFFRESIKGSTPFRSCKCADWEEFDSGLCGCTETVNMGYHVDQSALGNFYLRTNDESPYAQG